MLQFTLRGLHRRRWVVALVCALATALVGATAAQATVTTTTITSPTDPFFGFDQGQTQNVTISGTSDGNASDHVDILCYNDDGSTGSVAYTVAPGIAVDGSGGFSTSVPISQLVDQPSPYSTGYCRLRAVPAGTQPTTGLGSYSGPRSLVGYLTDYTNGSQIYDYYIENPQVTAADDYDSFSSCGQADSYLFDPSITGQWDATGFYCNDYPNNPAASDYSRAGVEVDGQHAYGSYLAWAINRNASGIEGLTINSITENPSNGDLTIVETEPILECVGNPFPANSGNCTAFVSSGVQVQRTITQTSDGHIVYIEDAYSSTNGSAHTVSLLLENDQAFGPKGASLGGDTVSYQFPGQSSFSTHSAGDTVSVPVTSPASILIENNATPDGSTSAARGAITYGQTPSNPFAFAKANNIGDSVFDASNDFTVPASGSVAIRYAYSTEYTSAAAQQDAYAAEDKFQAAMIAISSPANGATVSSPATVTGTASAGSGVKSVTVNGVAATVSGGSFSASVPLSKGANVLTAVVTSNGGASASASETVTTPRAPVANTGSAENVKSTSAELTGTVTPGSASTTYKFEYGKSTSYGKTTATVTLPASSSARSVSAPVKGLAANTTYHFRLVASSSAGSSTGQDMKFHTARAALKLSVAPSHAQAGTRRCYAFKASASAHPVSGATVLFAHHKARTSHAGKVTLCLSLARGIYNPTVSKAGLKSAHATVMVRPAKPTPTFTG